nr:EamA family transporter [Clostridium haemolyticum]
MLSLLEPVLYFFFESKGLKLCSASQAGIVIALIPIFVAILSSYILKEKNLTSNLFNNSFGMWSNLHCFNAIFII